MLVIRKLDKYNFTLATELEEPKTVNIAGKEVIYKYKNEDKYYGNLHGAIRGFIRHNGLDTSIYPPDEFKKIKPYSDEEEYIAFLEVRDVLNKLNQA